MLRLHLIIFGSLFQLFEIVANNLLLNKTRSVRTPPFEIPKIALVPLSTSIWITSWSLNSTDGNLHEGWGEASKIPIWDPAVLLCYSRIYGWDATEPGKPETMMKLSFHYGILVRGLHSVQLKPWDSLFLSSSMVGCNKYKWKEGETPLHPDLSSSAIRLERLICDSKRVTLKEANQANLALLNLAPIHN